MPEFVLHLLTPHHTNNHRARVLHLDALLFYVLAFAVFNLGIQWLHRVRPDVLGYATDIHLEQLLAATNVKRQAAGLSTLQFNNELSQAAAKKAKDMFAKNYWAHFAPDGKSPWDFISSSGYRYSIAGENLAKNFSTSTAVVDAWMASKTHRENIMKPQYRDIGFAIVNGVLDGEETTLVVQMFAATSSELAQATPPSKPIVVSSAGASIGQTAVSREQPSGLAVFGSAVAKPMVDASTLTRTITFLFVGFLLGVLAIDLWLVRNRRLVRLTGHTVGHLVFLGSLLIVMGAMARGTIL